MVISNIHYQMKELQLLKYVGKGGNGSVFYYIPYSAYFSDTGSFIVESCKNSLVNIIEVPKF